MVSPAGRRHRTNWLVSRIRSTKLYNTTRLICLFGLVIIANTIFAQGSNQAIQIELVAETLEGEALLHVRIPRGQTVEDAVLSQDDHTIILNGDTAQLPLTQFIILDASDDMVNLQSVVQSNIPRLWRSGENPTSLIFYNSSADFQEATIDSEFLDTRLSSYSINPGEPACLGAAIAALNEGFRHFERSWRILLITVGNFSKQSACEVQDIATAPAPIDVIAIGNSIDPLLQDLIDRSGGNIYSANLRSVEARINEVLTQWGQATYSLTGDIPEGWNSDEAFELEIVTSNGEDESMMLSFRDYHIPLPPTPTPQSTATVNATVESVIETTEATEVSVAVPQATEQANNTDNATGSDGVAILLIIGAVLFVIGAVVLALALSRVRRAPVDESPKSMPNFYETLDSSQPRSEGGLTATRVRERGITASEASDPVTQIAGMDDTYMADDLSADEDHDELLLTQVLSDARFRSMMDQSKTNEEIVGWMRVVTESERESRDYELTSRGAVVGRSQDCDIQITGDRAISRQHARFEVRSNGQVTVSRLSLVNPVVVGGVQVTNRQPLQPNDVIHLSDETRLIFIAKEEQGDETEITKF